MKLAGMRKNHKEVISGAVALSLATMLLSYRS